ncbi:hypothetical protein ACFQYP_02835 [Nonomuraea antimicrobica]
MSTRFGRSLRTRLALFASVTMLLLNVVVSAFVLYGIRNEVADLRAHEVSSKAVRVLLQVKRNRLPRVLPLDGLDGIQVVDPGGRPVAASSNLVGVPRLTTTIPHRDQANDYGELCELRELSDGCVMVVGLVAYQPEGDWVVYAFSQTVPWYVSPQVLLFQLCVTAALVVLAWFGVSRVVARTLAPVSSITRRLAEISAGGAGCASPCRRTTTRSRPWPRPATRRWNGWKARWSSSRWPWNGSAGSPPTPPTTCAARSPRCAPRSRTPCSTPRTPTGR